MRTIKKFNWKEASFELYLDKNDQIYDILTVTWKNSGNRRTPEEKKRHTKLFEMLKGNPYKIAKQKIRQFVDLSFVA